MKSSHKLKGNGGDEGILRQSTYNYLCCYLYGFYFHNVWVNRVGK